MQAQMMVGQALEHYAMMDFANTVLEQCWDICYDRQLTRAELTANELADVKVQKMDACAHQRTRRAHGGERSLCLDPLREALIGNAHASRSTAAARFVLGDLSLLLKYTPQPDSGLADPARRVLVCWKEALRAVASVIATPSKAPSSSASAEHRPLSFIAASVVKPSAQERQQRVVTHSLERHVADNSTNGSGRAQPALVPLASWAKRLSVRTFVTQSSDSSPMSIADLCRGSHQCESALVKSLIERSRKIKIRSPTLHKERAVRFTAFGTRGASRVHALSVYRTGARGSLRLQSTAWITRQSLPSAAATRPISSFCADEGQRTASQNCESPPSVAPSSSPRLPRVTRRLAAAWECVFQEAYVGHVSNTNNNNSGARGGFSPTQSFATEEGLRSHFQRALRWRSDASAHAAGGDDVAAGMDLHLMMEFVVDVYLSLCGAMDSSSARDAALVPATCNVPTPSDLQWRLFVLLTLADEVWAALRCGGACARKVSRSVSEAHESSLVRHCIVVVAAVQLCVLGHLFPQRGVADVTAATPCDGKTDVWRCVAEVPYSVHVMDATRRLVENLLPLFKAREEATVVSPNSNGASGVWSADSWLGRELCRLAETSWGSCLASKDRRHAKAVFSVPLLLLLRLLVESVSWHGLCVVAHVNSAQHVRHVSAAVLLIECVLEGVSEDEQVRCVDQLRKTLHLSDPCPSESEEVDDDIRERGRRHSRPREKGARVKGSTAALSPATACFVSQVLDGCPRSISRRLLSSEVAPQSLHSRVDSRQTLQAQESLASQILLRLAPGMVLSAAWRQRHACAAQSMMCASSLQIATAHEDAESAGTGAGGGTSADCVPLPQGGRLEQICARLCGSTILCNWSMFTAPTVVSTWCNVLPSGGVLSICLPLDSPAILRVAGTILETLLFLPPLRSAAPQGGEGRSRSRRGLCAPRFKKEDGGRGGAGACTGAAPSDSAAPTLLGILASLPSGAIQAETSQALLMRLCTALTQGARARREEGDHASLTIQRMRGAGVCLAVLLACASSTHRDQAAATRQLLRAVTSVVGGGEQTQQGCRGGDDVVALLRHWWQGAIGGVMLARHAQLVRATLRCANSPLTEPSGGETPPCDPLVTQSPAAQFAAWWESQSITQVTSHALPPHLRETCYWTGKRGRRLCNTVAHLIAKSATSSCGVASEELVSLKVPSMADAETVRVACAATYDVWSLQHICHLALASSEVADPSLVTASSMTPALHLPAVCALVTTEAGGALLESDLRSDDGLTSIFAHAMSAAWEAGDGALTVLQRSQGRPLTDQQHESLVEALRDFSKQRRVAEAVALFYAHERQHRRLRLPEVELFAETAKRAPLAFLVRVLLYVPPPCESAVLAKAIIAGAWKAYQRVLHQYSRRRAAPARGGPSRVSSLDAPSRRRVEQAWYESVAVARRALSLLPRTGNAKRCGEEDLFWILSILRRLMYARPRSLQICMPPPRASSTSMGTAVSVDEWDHVAVQSSQLVAALLQSSSGSEPVHHTLQGASVRQAIEEICQTTNYCDANGDATTAVQAYLRFSRFCSWSPPHRPSTLAAAQAAPNSRSSMPCSTHDWTVPLLPLDTSVSLLRQASTHMVTAYDDDVFAHAVPTSLSPSPPRRSVTLAALVAYVEAHQGPSVASAPEAPCSGAAPMQDTLEGQSRDADTELTMLRQLRAACEESGPAQPDTVAEASVDGSALANMCGRAAIPGNERHHVKSNSTPACATAAAATRRARAYAVNCIAAVERLSPTLPATLRRALHADSALIPLTAILHDALRCCRLRPRSMPVRDGDAAAVDELDTMSLHSLTDRVDSDDPAAADVLARLIAAMFGLDSGETGEAVHDARLSHSSSHAAGDMPASDESPVSMLVVVVRRTFVCRAARADLEFWRLAQHGDALLGYIWEYVWELYRLESTVLWVSPAQQQRAYLAVAECAQVIVAALQALDTWVAKMHSCEVRERGHNSDGDGVGHQVQGAACLKAAQDSLPDTASGEQGSRHSVDEWRVGLRSGTLQRVHTRLLEDADFPIDAGGRLGAVLPTWLSSSGLPPSGMAVTTSTAIAYVTTVIQHSRIAIENCSPASALMQLAVDPIAATSPTPADNPLGRGVISSRGARELLSATTQQYYDAVSRLVSASLPAIDGAGPLLPITPCGLAEDSLSYILQCVTATAAIRPPCHHPRTLGTLTETEAGVATALVARVAATDCMLQHLASLLQQTLVFAVAQAGSSTASGELLRSLWSLSAALEYAVVLLDECVAFCALLDLETAAAASPSSELLGGSDESLEKPCPVMSSVNVSLLTEKELAHIRAQLRWLAATFVDLYASRWWGGVHARLPESTRARLWRRDEVRAQHLHISLVLHHHTSASSDANISARLASAAEALHQALSCHASAAAANGALGSQRRDFLDLDALLDEEGVEAAHCTVPTLRTLEHALLAYLSVMQRRPHGMSVGVPDQTTSVSITALEASFQRAVIARLPPRQATLLWRLFPALLDDGCCFPGALDSQPRGGNHVAPAPLLCSQGFFAEEPSIVMCAVPTRLWKHLAHLGDASKWEVHSRPFRGSSACTETHGMHSERLVVYAALLSRNPLVVMNVVRHPLVRHHVLAEVRQGRRAEAQDGAGTESASSLSIEPRCEWLKKLLLYAAENDLVAEAKFASSGEAGESSGSVTQRTGCGTPSRDSDGRPLSATTSSSPPDPPAFMLQPLREEFVSALVLAVLRDESLMSEGQMCGLAASASGSAPTADNPPLSLLKCLLPPSPPPAAMLSAQRRERVLLELVQYLGDVTPHAWRTAFRWITATPYPPAAHEQLLTFTLTETALQTEQERNTLSCAAATTLRRLRVALLSCGPWPPYAARRLLEYAARVQEAATVKAAATRELASDSETAAMPFPEARVLYQQLQLQPPEREQDDVASLSPSSITAAGVGATMPRQAGRFLVKSPLLMRPSTGAPSAIVGDTSHVDYPVVSVPLSAIQLACEEGARLTEALRSSTAPAAGTAAARIARRMCDLASAPSHTACVHLLSDDAFAQDLVATPDKCAASTLMLTWRTLLLRSAELDCGERGFFSSANVGAGVTVAEVRGWTQGLYRQEGGSRDQCSVTVLDVYALLFFTASRVHDACRAAPSPPLESGGSHWWISAQHQLSSLKREIAAYWAAVWADEVMPTEWMLRCTTATSHAKAIRARISEYCRSGADAYSTRSPRLGFVTLKDHLRRAQTRLETASQECPSSFDSSTQALRSSGTTRSSAAAELARIHGEAAVQLRDAGARMTSFTHSIVTNPSQTLEKSEEKAAATPMWSLWPPAGWETYRLWVYMGESLQQKTAAMFKLHNPVSVVMYLRMWQRTRASAQQTGQPDAYGTRPPQGAGKGVVTYHEVHGTAWALVPAMCSQAVQAAQPTRERGFSSGDRRRGSRSTLGSLMDAWCVADVFVRDGHVAFACLPCDGNFEASGGCYPTPRSSSGDGDACETFVWSDDSLSTAANTTPAGAGVVMQVLLDLVSLEDARLQRGGQQHRSRQRTRSPLHRTPSDDTLVLLSVLRQLRQRLLPPRAAAGTAASTYDSLISSSSSAKVLERDTSDSTFAVSPWAAHVPLSSTCEPSTPPKQGSGKYFGAGTDQLMRVVSHIGSAWHSYLHVLHLCGDGLLNRAAARSGRRASPSATTLIHVAHQVQRLVTLSSLGVWGTDSLVLSPWRSRLLTEGDAQRIICFQMRGLQRTRDHVNVLGWTLEQQVELQRAHQSTVATVEALCTLQRHYRHDPEGLREEGAHDAAATQDMGLATKPKGQATASVTTQQGSLNRVEQATAGCFYPALVRLLRQISVSHSSRAGAPAPPHETPESQRCSPGDNPLTGTTDGVETEVLTEFASAVATVSHRRRRSVIVATAESDKAAAALLAAVHSVLHETTEQPSGLTKRCHTAEAAHHSTPPTPRLLDGWRELHALLSAVVDAVQRRSRDGDQRLLLDFLRGDERRRLWPLASGAEKSYLDTLQKVVSLAASRPSPTEPPRRLVEAGLTLCALLQPWISFSSTSRESCSVEAALCLVTLALQPNENLEGDTDAAADQKSHAASLSYLADVVLVEILHRKQAMRLSVRSIVLLGIIYSQLKRLKSERRGVPEPTHEGWRHNSRTAPPQPLLVDANNALLCRILNALGALSEQDAAEVRDAWMAERSIDAFSPVTCSAACGAPAPAPGSAAHTRASDKAKPGTGSGGPNGGERSGTHVIRMMYQGSLQVLRGGGIGGDAAEHGGGRWASPLLCAATRLRTWLACEAANVARLALSTASQSESSSQATWPMIAASGRLPPQVCVLEDVLCAILDALSDEARAAHGSRKGARGLFSGEKRDTWATRREWLACLRIYGLYSELRRTCTTPAWGWQYLCMRGYAQTAKRESPLHRHEGGCGDSSCTCVSDVASLLLELTVVAALSTAETWIGLQDSSAVSAARQIALLSAFVRCCDKLGTPLPSLPSPQRPQWWASQGRSLSSQVMVGVALPDTIVLGRVRVDAHAAVRHLATRLLCRLSDDRSPSTSSATNAFQDWRALLTPLQALQRVTAAFAVPDRSVRESVDGEAADGSVWLLNTPTAGLQWTQACPNDTSRDTSADHHRCAHHDGSVHGFYYATLRLLCRTAHLAEVPPPILLEELLCPLAGLERVAAETSVLPLSATEGQQQCAAQATERGSDGGAAVRRRKTINRLDVLANMAKRIAVSPALRVSPAAGGACGGDGGRLAAGWTTALLIFKVLAQIEDALYTQCAELRGDPKTFDHVVQTNRTLCSPSDMFAARYADLLAQRRTHAADYLAFMLLVSRYRDDLLPVHEDAAASNSEVDRERPRRLRHAQLRHVIALAVPPAAVGSVMALFQRRPATHRVGAVAAVRPRRVPLTAALISTLQSHSSEQLQGEDRSEGANKGAGPPPESLTPDEATLVQRLHDLLQTTSRGKLGVAI